MANKMDKRLPRDIREALKKFPKVVEKKEKAARQRKRVLRNFAPFSRELKKLTDKSVVKVHPWRLCPMGQHWVATHPVSVPISEKNPSGQTMREGHCRKNRSNRDQMYSDEIHRIALDHFTQVAPRPKADNLGLANGNDYDDLIAGWTSYWNSVLNTRVPLDPNLVKALIQTESGFDRKATVLASKGNWARGLMQVTDQTLDILSDEKGELKNFLIDIDQNEILDPNLNICAGIRWLFHKKYLLERRLRRPVSWEEATMEYKSYTRDLKKKEPGAVEQRDKFLKLYKRLSQ